MARVFLDHVTKIYRSRNKKVVAVEDVVLDIHEGTFVGLLGPSGCGKTTTLRIIAGLETPTSGRVYFDDKDVTDLDASQRNVAMVFQFPVLYPTLTVYENIALSLKSTKMERGVSRQEVKKVAEQVGITKYLDMKTDKLDLNTRQRVALAKVLVRDPTIFLLDEPLTVVDPKARVELRTLIKRIQSELRRPMIYVTHDQSEAMTLCDKIAVMKDGKVVQYDTPERLYEHPTNPFVGWFIGNPGMNLIECSLITEGEKAYLVSDGGFKFEVSFIGDKLKALTERRKLILGVRPEYVQIGTGQMRGKCIHVEHFGNRKVVHLQVYDSIVRAKVPYEVNVSIGDVVPVGIVEDKVLIYDSDKGTLLV